MIRTWKNNKRRFWIKGVRISFGKRYEKMDELDIKITRKGCKDWIGKSRKGFKDISLDL